MSNAISTLIFASRGVDQVKDGNWTRVLPTSGQLLNCLRYGSELEGKLLNAGIVNSAKISKYYNNFINAAKDTSTIFGKTSKGLQFVSTHINPFIGIATGGKIALSENKTEALCKDGLGYTGMLVGEKLAKPVLNSVIPKIGASLPKILLKFGINIAKTDPRLRVALYISQGLLFAGASIASWLGGAKIGEKIYNTCFKQNHDEKAQMQAEIENFKNLKREMSYQNKNLNLIS